MKDSKSGYSSFSDSELVEEYKKTGDKVVVGELYKRYTHLVLGLCIHFYNDRDEAEDAVLMIFEKLFENLKHHEVNTFKAWLITIAKNHCLNDIRLKENRKKLEPDYQYYIKQNNPQDEENNDDEADMMLKRLEKSMLELNDFQKRCIELYYLKNKTYAQIVELTGYSMKEVKSYLQNGKRNLKLLMLNNK